MTWLRRLAGKRRRKRRRGCPLSNRSPLRNDEGERASDAQPTFRPDIAAQQVRQTPAKSTQTRAFVQSRRIIVDLTESFEEIWELGARNTDSGIGHSELYARLRLARWAQDMCPQDLNGESHFALFGKFYCIIEQIEQHLLNSPLVADHGDGEIRRL